MTEWQPTTSIENLQKRASLTNKIREFFAARDILEVQTPLLCHSSVTDPELYSMMTSVILPGQTKRETLYLQTSPEYAMKRLLAFGSGPIYQICKAFRNDESGRLHNPEFTILEWYRLGFDHYQLMQEVDEFLQLILNSKPALFITYQDAFIEYCGIDPLAATIPQLIQCAQKKQIDFQASKEDNDHKDTWLHLLMSHCIEPQLGHHAPTFIYDYPVSQAALAKVSTTNPLVAHRFEVYIKGVELANGFNELTHAKEQHQRFNEDLQKRLAMGLDPIPIDHYLLSALEHGMPACSGVALGLDRLMMLALKVPHIKEVISFTTSFA